MIDAGVGQAGNLRGGWVQPGVRAIAAVLAAGAIVCVPMSIAVATMPASVGDGSWAESLAGRLMWTGMVTSFVSGLVAGVICSVRADRLRRIRGALLYCAAFGSLMLATSIRLGWHWSGALSLVLQCAPCVVICLLPRPGDSRCHAGMARPRG